MPFVVGENIGPYRILEQLGRGGMATVFKAYHAALDRYVAIKALHPAFLEDPNFHARFQREARVVAKLEHPNIVPIYDFAEHEDRPYLVMKFIEGDTLKARLIEGNIDRDELIQIVDAVGAGLSYAHQQGILHRDIKPSNVLLGQDGRVYLADFGLARIAQAGESTLSSDMMLGTPQYISPEQAMGLGELDERTDIYSFGVMLYEMTVGKVPFSADTPFSIIHDHIYTPLPLPTAMNAEVSAAVERVLLKALAKERDDRYPDASELANAFNQALISAPGVAPVVVKPSPEKTFIPALEPGSVVETVPEDSIASVAFEPNIPPPFSTVDEKHAVETAAAQPIVASSLPGKKKRRFRWWFIPLGIVFLVSACFCGLVGLGALMDWGDNGRIDPPVSEQLPEQPSPEPFQEAQQPSELDAVPLDEAQQLVNENPDDAWAWLELARAHWQAGRIQDGREALNRALDLVGDDPNFYFDTAEELAEAQFWIEAAHLYLEAILRFTPGDVPPESRERLAEAAYWAAEQPQAEGEIPISRIAEVDPPIERVVKARNLFYRGQEDEAYSTVDQVLWDMPGMPEALYLQSEIFYTWGDVASAYDLLFELDERDDTPDWIREAVNQILQDAFSMQSYAQEEIDQDPENPYVYLPLYEWYLSFGLYEQANETIQQALHWAGDNLDFVIEASNVAARNGAWLEKARLLSYAGQLNPDIITPEFSEDILQTLYYGSIEPGALEVLSEFDGFLPEGERGAIRDVYRDALIARYKLYYEDIDEAQALINEVVARNSLLPMPRLVQAEAFLFTGDFQQSERILLELQNSRAAPPWVKDEVQFMLEEINPDS